MVISLLCLRAQTHSIRENSPTLNLQALSIKERQINQKEKLSNFSFEIPSTAAVPRTHHRGALQRALPSTVQGRRVFKRPATPYNSVALILTMAGMPPEHQAPRASV